MALRSVSVPSSVSCTFSWRRSVSSRSRVTSPRLSRVASALEMLARSKSRGETPPLKVLGEHPEDGQPVAIYEGRYGPYVRHGKRGKQLASIPKDREVDSVTLAEAITWINERVAKKGTGRGSPKSSAARKTTGKKKADSSEKPPKPPKKAKRKKKAD